MRSLYIKNESESWEIERDGSTVLTWAYFNDYWKAVDHSNSVMDAFDKNREAGIENSYSYSLDKGKNGKATFNLNLMFNDAEEAKAKFDQLVEEKLSEGFVLSEKKDGSIELHKQLIKDLAANRKKTSKEIPDCFAKLTKEVDINTEKAIPDVLQKIYGIQALKDSKDFNPVQSMKFIGQGSTDLYWQCGNTPEHHIHNAAFWDPGPLDWFEETGKFYGFDFVAVNAANEKLSLRALINSGDGDSNDGFWGELWNRDTGERVANIESTGDGQSTITVVNHADMFESQEISILDCIASDDEVSQSMDEDQQFKNEKDEIWEEGIYLQPVEILLANQLKLERIIDLAIRIFSCHINDAYYAAGVEPD